MNEAPITSGGALKVKRRIPWTWIGLLLVAAIIAGISHFELWLSAPDSQVVEADKGFRKAKETINPEQLRAWALKEIETQKSSITNEDGLIPIPNSEIPSYIKELFDEPPAVAGITKYGSQKCVWFNWGGSFFDWSIFIGPTNLVPQYSSEETTTRWVPGIIFSIYDK
jgi:hypothetical protein